MTDTSTSRSRAAQQMGAHRSLRVLFVDDEKSLREFMRSELPRLGHEVTACEDFDLDYQVFLMCLRALKDELVVFCNKDQI